MRCPVNERLGWEGWKVGRGDIKLESDTLPSDSDITGCGVLGKSLKPTVAHFPNRKEGFKGGRYSRVISISRTQRVPYDA